MWTQREILYIASKISNIWYFPSLVIELKANGNNGLQKMIESAIDWDEPRDDSFNKIKLFISLILLVIIKVNHYISVGLFKMSVQVDSIINGVINACD